MPTKKYAYKYLKRKNVAGKKTVSKKLLASLGTGAVVLTGIVSAVWAPSSHAVTGFPVIDSGEGPAGQQDSNWDIMSVGVTGAVYTSDNWIRLVDNNTNEITNMLNKTSFSSKDGFVADFDYRMTGGTQQFGVGDGFSFYLTDGNADVSNGGAGAGLAYATSNTVGKSSGVTDGVLGVGFDAYGNYGSSIDVDGNSNCLRDGFGSNRNPNTVGIRGSGGQPGTSQCGEYPTIGGKVWSVPDDIPTSSNPVDPSQDATSTYRHVRITVVPNGTSATVDVAMSDPVAKDQPYGAMTSILGAPVSLSGVTLPSSLKLGFGASTGGATQFMDLRRITISAVADLGLADIAWNSTPQTDASNPGYLPGSPISFSLGAWNAGPTAIPADTADALPHIVADLTGLPVTLSTAAAGATNTQGGIVDPTVNGNAAQSAWWANVTNNSPSNLTTLKVDGTINADAPAGDYTFKYYIPTEFPTDGSLPTYDADLTSVTPNSGISDPLTADNMKTATFTVAEAPNLKWGTPTAVLSGSAANVGSNVTFTFPYTNTGNTPMTVSANTVDFSGNGVPVPMVCDTDEVAPNGTGTCSATYTLTQGDLNQGSVQWTVSGVAEADKADSTAVETSATYSVPTTGASISLQKSVTPEQVSKEGDEVTYSFEVTNTGTIELSNISIEDTSFSGSGTLGDITCSTAPLPPGGKATCTADYTVTQADIDNIFDGKTIVNTATATASFFGGTQSVTSASSTASFTGNPESKLSLVKTVGAADPTASETSFVVGEVVDYKFVVTNSGATDLTVDPDTLITEKNFSGTGPLDMTQMTCDPQITAGYVLAPNDTVTCSVPYTLTQDDIDSDDEEVTNTAEASAVNPGGEDTLSGSVTATLKENPKEELTISSVNVDVSHTDWEAGVTKADFKLIVTNSGQVTLGSVGADIFGLGDTPLTTTCAPISNITPGQFVTCTGEYTLTQQDVDAGKVDFAAGAAANPVNGETTIEAAEVSGSFSGTAVSALTLTKTAADPDDFVPGSSIDYTFEVTNTGATTIDDIDINDAGPTTPAGAGDGTMGSVECDASTLAPEGSTTCTVQYTLGQGDVNWGELTNTATASGETMLGASVASSSAAVTSGPFYTNPDQSREKLDITLAAPTIDPGDDIQEGSKLTYTATVTNTGPVIVNDVVVSSPSLSEGTDAGNYQVSCPKTSLEPGESMSCDYYYYVSSADLPVGQAAVSAQAVGKNVRDDVTPVFTSNPATATFTIPGGMTVSGNAVLSSSGYVVGSQVTYTVQIENTGDSELNSLGVNVDDFGGTGTKPAFTCTPDPLAAGKTSTCTATYALTQEDVNNYYKDGALDLSVTASAKTGADPTDQWDKQLTFGPFKETFNGKPTVGIEVTGTDPTMSPAAFKAGATVEFSYTVTNSGAVDFDDVTLAATSNGSDFSCTPDITSLGTGASVNCTVTYSLTQADVDAGQVSMGLNATGQYGNDLSTSAGHLETLAVDPIGTVSLTKSVGAASGGTTNKGTVLPYTFEIENTGNATLTNLELSETAFTGTAGAPTISCPDGSLDSLAPEGKVSCTANYTVTQDDVDAQKIDNTAKVTANYNQGAKTATAESTYSYPIVSTAGVSIVQTVSNPQANPVVGDTLTFAFKVTNTGGYSLNNWQITSSNFTGSPALSISCPSDAPTILQPGATVECTAAYALTDDDLNAGEVASTAQVTADPPSPIQEVSDSSTVTSKFETSGGISIVKTAALGQDQKFVAGDTIDFHFVVTNTGDLPITGAAISDTITVAQSDGTQIEDASIVDLSTCAIPSPFEGADTYSCDATYTLTQNDINWGGVSNTAKVTGTFEHDGQATTAENESTIVFRGIGQSSVQLTKTVSDPGEGKFLPGTGITYSFDVLNTGATTLQDITLSDNDFSGSGALGDINCDTQTDIDPGQSRTCTASYTLTQDDVNAGVLNNSATVSGQTLNDSLTVSDSSTATLVGQGITDAISITNQALTKDAANLKTGSVVKFAYVVTNSGDTTLTDVSVTNSIGTALTRAGTVPDCGQIPSKFQPGQSFDCTLSYKLTDADLKAGKIVDTATATGTAPSGKVATSSATASIEGLKMPAASPEKLSTTGASIWIGIIALIALPTGAVMIAVSRRREKKS